MTSDPSDDLLTQRRPLKDPVTPEPLVELRMWRNEQCVYFERGVRRREVGELVLIMALDHVSDASIFDQKRVKSATCDLCS